MYLPPRQAEIVQLARENGRVLVEELVGRFKVTPQTIRKDLNDLCEMRLLSRIHGGAIFPSGVENVEYEARRKIAAAEKEAIGARRGADSRRRLAVRQYRHHHRGGGRGAARPRRVDGHHQQHQRRQPHARLPADRGGHRRRRGARPDGGIVGEAAVDFIRQFKVDYAVIGVSAIDHDGALLDFDYREVKVAQAIIANARHVILVADATKFERAAPVRIGHLSQVDTFVTDACDIEAVRAICREAEVRLIEAGSG